MPQALPLLVVAAIEAGAYAAGYIALTSALLTFAITAVTTGLQMLLASGKGSGGAPPPSASLDPGSKVTGNAAATPRQILYGRSRVAGTIVFQTTSDNNGLLYLVVALLDHQSESIDEVWFGSEQVWTAAAGNVSAKFAPFVSVFPHLGAAAQSADDNLVAAVPGQWTSAHRLSGVTYIYLGMRWNRDAFGGFSPSSIWTVCRGKLVYDPRIADTVYSANPALCVADYLASARHGLGAAYGSEIDNTALAASASVCDESVTAGGVTESRFTCNGVIGLSQKPMDVIGGMLAAMVGRVVWTGGLWKVQAAAWQTPTLVFDETDLRAGFTVQNLLGRANSYNAEKGSYVNPAKQWQADTFPPLQIPAYVAQDGGEVSWKDIQLPFTDSPTMAQRIAIIDLRRLRQTLSLTYPCKLTGWRAQVGDVVQINNTRLGWSAKNFEVVSVTMAFENGPSTGTGGAQPILVGVDLELRETDISIFDATLIAAAGDPAPNTNLPDYFNVLPPSNIRAAESLYATRDGGGVKAKWSISWDQSPDMFVQSGGFYRLQYRAVGASSWVTVTDTTQLTADVLDIGPGTYEAEVIAFNWVGGPSSPLSLPPTTVAGLSAAPSAPVNLTVAAMESFALARCALSSDLDVQQGGFIVFRHSPATTGATWDAALSLADPLPANSGAWALPLKTGTYLAKFYDSSGIPSASAATFVQTQASALTFTALGGGLTTQDPAFAGAKTGCYVDGGILKLTGGANISTIPLLSAAPSIAYFGGVVASGTYDYDAVMDLGSVKRHRLTNTVSAQIISAVDRIGARMANVSTWPRVGSGVTGDEADSYLMVASTQTDPATSPTWTDWQRLDASTFSARAHKFRRVLESKDASFTIGISADSVAAEGV